jgi:hypothetical protein
MIRHSFEHLHMSLIAAVGKELDGVAKEHTNGLGAEHSHGSAGGLVDSGVTPKKARQWHFDTLQVHSGLEDETAHGQCSLPIYNSASFRFKTSKSIEAAYSFEDGPRSQFYMYSRLSNVSGLGCVNNREHGS